MQGNTFNFSIIFLSFNSKATFLISPHFLSPTFSFLLIFFLPLHIMLQILFIYLLGSCPSFPSASIWPGLEVCQESVGQSQRNGACTPPAPPAPHHPPPPAAQHSANSSKQKVIHQLLLPDVNTRSHSCLSVLPRFCCVVTPLRLCRTLSCLHPSSSELAELFYSSQLLFTATKWRMKSHLHRGLKSHPLKSYLYALGFQMKACTLIHQHLFV